jgi:hypothetical protein
MIAQGAQGRNKMEAAGVKLDADGAYRVNDVGVGIA